MARFLQQSDDDSDLNSTSEDGINQNFYFYSIRFLFLSMRYCVALLIIDHFHPKLKGHFWHLCVKARD